MIPNAPQEYEHKNSVVVPLAFFDKLMRCYYGTGPRDGEQPYQIVPENPTTQVIPEISELKNTTIGMETPKGYKPKGVAERKLKAKQSGTRHDKTTEEQA
jgi:hypothetical protein